MRRPILASAMLAFAISACCAQTVYPVDRAEILAGSRFDVKVELSGRFAPGDVSLTVNGADHAGLFGKAATFIEKEDGKEQSALILRDVSIDKPGRYTITVATPASSREVTWTVYETPARKAKNVVLLIGDGMSLAHRAAARLLSKGIAEGKAFGKLAMDDMPHMALVSTAGIDSIITDSANSASAYATGHKTAANAMGVYADRTADPFDDPRVETIVSLAKRRNGMAVGLVTNTEIQDATPAAMVAHTRHRATYDQIVSQYFAAQPEVLMGGGLANFLPKGAAGRAAERPDRLCREIQKRGLCIRCQRGRVESCAAGHQASARPVHTGNMDGVLDRKFLKARRRESLSGSARSHRHDRESARYPVAESERLLPDGRIRNDRQIHASARHGTCGLRHHHVRQCGALGARLVESARRRHADPGASGPRSPGRALSAPSRTTCRATRTCRSRERVRIYEKAGFPNYPAPDADGYPSRVDVSRRTCDVFRKLPDHYETFRPRLDNPNEPTMAGSGRALRCQRRTRAPGAVLRFGNLPRLANASVHSGEDVILTASGPGSEAVRGQMDNTEVFRVMAEALGLGAGLAASAASAIGTALQAVVPAKAGTHNRSCEYGPPLSRERRPESLNLSLDHHLLDVGDFLRRIEALRAGLRAIQDGVAAIEPERILQEIEPLAGSFVARILQPAAGLQQCGGAEIAIAIPPIARAGGRAAGAQDAFVETIELLAVALALPPFLLRRRRLASSARVRSRHIARRSASDREPDP